MSTTSSADIEKEAGWSKEQNGGHLSQEQEDFREASEPPFTAHIGNESPSPQDGSTLEKTVSTKSSVNNIKHVPDGGLTAWLQVLASFFLFFNSWVSTTPTTLYLILTHEAGHRKYLRDIPNILRDRPPRFLYALGNFLDREYTGIPAHACGSGDRPHLRCRLCTHAPTNRLVSGSLWPDDALAIDSVLAGHAFPGHLHRSWLRLSLRTGCRYLVYLLQH
jgi:hypothetical protein